MIKICFPPGCYGHYLAQCLYYFTDIDDHIKGNFVFGPNGDSHLFRQNRRAQQSIQIGHFSYETSGQYHPATLIVHAEDRCVTILPVSGHWLDYYDNQYVKQSKSDLLSYVSEQISLSELEQKLQDNWQYHYGMRSNIPQWIMRELFSFYIHDILCSSYLQDRCALPDSIKIPATMFFVDFVTEFQSLCQALDLQIVVDDETLQSNNHQFQQLQKYHNLQICCERWVDDVLQDRDSVCPALTVFDEAYIQHLLRRRGFEIRCDGLDQFPGTSSALRSLIYPT